MSFRRRNVGITTDSKASHLPTKSASSSLPAPSGVRPSPLDGRATTSTGTPTLDNLLAGHAGLPLGTSILIGENGTTDYAGALLRYCAAEGLIQGHRVYVVGLRERWGRELPGLVGASEQAKQKEKEKEKDRGTTTDGKMKIAWRYERLGQFDEGSTASRAEPGHQRAGAETSPDSHARLFCHTFDMTKKLEHPPDASISYLKLSSHPDASPFTAVLEQLHTSLADAPQNIVHRVIVPGLLSPQIYPPHSSQPHHILRFLQGIRVLLSAYPTRLVVMASLPLSLFPRSSGLVRWMELLSDGVIELTPFPHSSDQEPNPPLPGSGDSGSNEEPPQGLLKMHRLPIFHERGGGSSLIGEDWAFTLSRRKFTIKPYNLPPIEGDTQAQQTGPIGQQPKKSDMEF